MSGAASHYNLAIIITEQRRGQAIRELEQRVTKATQSMEGMQGGAGRASNAMDKWKDRAGQLGRKIKNVLVPAILLATTAVVAFAKNSVGEFAQFDQKMHETFTLIPGTSAEFRENMISDLTKVGESVGKLSDETLPALYQALSAGIPEENAVKAVELASRAAIAGAAELETTMKLGAAVVNAYGGELYDLTEVYDIIFQLIDKGVPRMNDWTTSMQNVISIASESRVPFEDIAAALAVMTRQGDSAAEATELLGFLLMQLAISGTGAAKAFAESTSMSFREWLDTGKGLVEGLVAMEEHAESTGQSLGDMIGGDSKFFRDQQAYRAAMELTGIHMDEFVEMRTNFEEDQVAGLNDMAFEEASDNAQFEIDQMNASWETLKIQIGDAIWNHGIFLGETGKDMVEYATIFAKYITGSWMSFNDEMLRSGDSNGPMDNLHEVRLELERLSSAKELFFEGGTAGQHAWQILMDNAISKIYTYTQDYAVFNETLKYGTRQINDYKDTAESFTTWDSTKFGVPVSSGYLDKYGNAYTVEIEGLEKTGVQYFHNLRTLNQLNEAQATQGELADAAQKRWERASGAEETRLATAKASIQDLDTLGAIFPIGDINLAEAGFRGLNGELIKFNELIYWVPIQTTKMSDATTASFLSQKDNYADLAEAQKELQESGGEWRDFIVNNQAQINAEMGLLTNDLTDEQKDAMWEIVRTAEEGGEEWLNAWDSLQTDLTEIQRAEAIKRLSDLTDANGSMGTSWDGNAERALAAADGVIAAIQAIKKEHDNLVLAVAKSKFIERFGEQTVEMQLAYLETEVILGRIPRSAADALAGEIQYLSNLELVTGTMLDGFLEDGKLAPQELEAIGRASDIAKGQVQNFTKYGLQAFLDVALSDIGGFPHVGETIKTEVVTETMHAQREMENMVKNGPYIPEFEINKKPFDTTYKEMDILIRESLGPHTVEFWANYNNFQDQGDNLPDGPPRQHATGIRGGIVPGGYPNDSYYVGLTSGEEYNVYRRGEQAPKDSNGSNITNNVTINNHTRAAANVAASQMEALTRKRINGFMGE